MNDQGPTTNDGVHEICGPIRTPRLQAIHLAYDAAGVQVHPNVFGVRNGSGRTLWCRSGTGDGDVAGAALQSLFEGRAGSGGESLEAGLGLPLHQISGQRDK